MGGSIFTKVCQKERPTKETETKEEGTQEGLHALPPGTITPKGRCVVRYGGIFYRRRTTDPKTVIDEKEDRQTNLDRETKTSIRSGLHGTHNRHRRDKQWYGWYHINEGQETTEETKTEQQ